MKVEFCLRLATVLANELNMILGENSMTLYQQLRSEMENHRGFWNYYDMKFEDVFQNEGAASDFIYNYFQRGSKLYTLDTWINSQNEHLEIRNVHTVNVFFIGAFLQRTIDEDIAIRSEVSLCYPFSYIWYLLCLAHDLGYVYENYSEVYLELPSQKDYYNYNCNAMHFWKFLTRKIWYQDHGIDIAYIHPSFGVRSKVAYYNRNATGKLEDTIKYNNGTIIKRPRYSKETKNNYFYYRLWKMGKLDHGIVGADEFFSRMIVNYVKEYRKMATDNFFRGDIYEFYNQQGLHFCIEQIKLFAYIADCIAAHNMYKAEDDDCCKERYKYYSLNCLLPDKFQLISYRDNPLLFILCVADTIEPSKRFPNYCSKDILNLISINYNVNTNLLHVGIDEEIYDSDAGHKYVADIEGLAEWCDIRTNVTSQRVINY